jgi:hypothetical protein
MLGDDLATDTTEHRSKPMPTDASTSANVEHPCSEIDRDFLRDEEVVGSRSLAA